jgi:hypothetical protein
LRRGANQDAQPASSIRLADHAKPGPARAPNKRRPAFPDRATGIALVAETAVEPCWRRRGLGRYRTAIPASACGRATALSRSVASPQNQALFAATGNSAIRLPRRSPPTNHAPRRRDTPMAALDENSGERTRCIAHRPTVASSIPASLSLLASQEDFPGG